MAARRRLLTTEVVEGLIANRRAGRCSAKYEEWLRYHLGFLVRLYVELPRRPEDVDAVLASVRGLSEATCRNVWSALRMLFRFAVDRYGAVDAMHGVRRPGGGRRRLPRTLSADQVEALLAAHSGRRREFALLLFMLDTGARLGEVYGLRVRDIEGDADRGYVVLVDGKTGQREVPLSEETVVAIRRLSMRARGPEGEIWFGRRGPLTMAGVQKVVQRALLVVGVRGGPHLLRHTFAKLYVKNRGDVVSLQRILGHASIETTRIYLEFATDDLQAQHARCSPVARRAYGGGA